MAVAFEVTSHLKIYRKRSQAWWETASNYKGEKVKKRKEP